MQWTTLPFDWLLWSDRDLVRASRLAVDRPVLGAEVSYGDGARLPGGLLAELWGLALAVSPEPASVYRLGLAMQALALLTLGVAVGRRAGAFAGATAAAVTACTLAWTSSTGPIWNPAFVPLFAVAVLVAAERALATGRAGAVAAVALAGALGAQLHLTVGLVALLALGVVGVLAPRTLARGLPGGVAAVGLAFLPYLVVDGARGWPNTRALGGAPRGAAGDGDVAAAAAWLRLDVDFAEGLARHGDLLLLGVAVAVGVGATGLLRRDRERAALALPATLVVATVALLARQDTGTAALRYALATTPALGWLAGEGWGRLARSRALLGVVVPPVVTALVVVVTGSLVRATELHAGEASRWSSLTRLLADVAAATGWSLRDTAGRTAVWERQDDVWRREARRGIDWLLLQDGTTFPGSLPSPCALVLVGGRDVAVDDAWLAAALAPSLGRPRLIDQAVSGWNDRLVRYALDGGPCPTSLSQRYLETPAEADVRASWRVAPGGESVAVAARPGRRVGRLSPPDAPAIGVAVDLDVGPGRLDATLHANQLRGRAYNTELLEDAWVVRPRLRLERSGEVRELILAPGLVGDGAVLTPLHAGGRLPAGDWSASLQADVATARATPGPTLPPTVPARLDLGVVHVPAEAP